jgi:Arc/MetJ family transcription regulator
MRTTIELDDALVAQARAVIGGPTLRATIEESLREAIGRRSRDALRQAIRDGEDLLAIDDHDLARMRRDRLQSE